MIVYITDENYVMPMLVSIYSLLENYKGEEKLEISILANGISTESANRISKINGKNGCSCRVIDASKYSQIDEINISLDTHVSKSAFLKFELANIFSEYDKLLYLDCDLLILQDISELLEIDITDYYVAAVDDVEETILGEQAVYAKRLGIEDRSYFNSGVMLLNLKKMREESLCDKLYEYRRKGTNHFMDQDAFNVILGPKRYILERRYNFITELFRQIEFNDLLGIMGEEKNLSREEFIGKQKILHFAGAYKPWDYKSHIFTDLFMHYYEMIGEENQRELLPIEYPLWLDLSKSWGLIRERDELIVNYEERVQSMTNRDRYREWAFPYADIPRGSSIVIYGAGKIGQSFVKQLEYTEYCNIHAWVDSKWEEMNEDRIQSPDILKDAAYDLILIAIMDSVISDRIKCELEDKYGIKKGIVTLLHH